MSSRNTSDRERFVSSHARSKRSSVSGSTLTMNVDVRPFEGRPRGFVSCVMGSIPSLHEVQYHMIYKIATYLKICLMTVVDSNYLLIYIFDVDTALGPERQTKPNHRSKPKPKGPEEGTPGTNQGRGEEKNKGWGLPKSSSRPEGEEKNPTRSKSEAMGPPLRSAPRSTNENPQAEFNDGASDGSAARCIPHHQDIHTHDHENPHDAGRSRPCI